MADDSSSAFQPTGAGQQAAQLPIQAGVVQAPRAVQHGLVEQLGSFVTDDILEVDNDWDSDSALGSMNHESTTQSIASSLYDHVEENGRTYHRYKEGKYPLPNDKAEQERLDFQHEMMRHSLDGRLYAAPIPPNPRNVLDVGTGTGVWAVEFAVEHPASHVIGTDLSPIQPPYVPPNVTFEICDAEDSPWSFRAPFDFVHMRAMLTAFGDPKAVLQSAFDSLAPGGYIQLRDPIMPFRFHGCPPRPEPDCALAEWGRLIMQASTLAGRKWDNAQHYERWLRELGYVDVTARREVIPLSPWAKSRRMKYLSLWLQHNMLIAMEGISLRLFTKVLGWERERLMEFLTRVRKDIQDVRIHAYSEGVLVWARKPFENEVPAPAAGHAASMGVEEAPPWQQSTS